MTTTNGGSIETGYTDSTGSYTFIELTNLDQQDVLIQSQLSGSAVATLTNVTGLTGTYKILVPAPVAAHFIKYYCYTRWLCPMDRYSAS